MSFYDYQKLIKPKWAPPKFLFGTVWPVLYIIIFISYGFVFYLTISGQISWIITIPFVLNLIFNFSFTFFQFKLNNNLLALIDILLVLATLIWAVIIIFPTASWIAYVNIPYLLWVSFATALQLSITLLNRSKR